MRKSADCRPRLLRIWIAFAPAMVALFFLACDDSGSPTVDGGGNGGKGGSAIIGGMTAGSGGDAPKDGGADASPGSGCFPQCVQALFAKCWPTGPTCSLKFSGSARLECFSNGVKMDVDSSSGGLVTLPAPNNSTVCYELLFSTTSTGTHEWKYFAAGFPSTPVATATFPSKDSKVGTIRCEPFNGKPGTDAVPIDLASPACDDSRNGFGGERIVKCTQDGMCAVPIAAQMQPAVDPFRSQSLPQPKSERANGDL